MKICKISDTHRGFDHNTSKVHDKWHKHVLSKLDYDVLVHAGDLGSHKTEHVLSMLKFLRKIAGSRPVIIVLGNHDYWGCTDPEVLEFEIWQAAVELNIVMLFSGANSFAIGDVLFVGWTGWYNVPPAHSNDFNWIPERHPEGFLMNQWFKSKEVQELEVIVDTLSAPQAKTFRKRVAITHFPITLGYEPHAANPRHFLVLQDLGIDVLLYGHSHRGADHEVNGIRIVNAGCDYNKPKAVVVDV